MLGQNIENLISMYWEGDRSKVKQRYDELFGGELPEDENIPESEANSDESSNDAGEKTSKDEELRLVNAGDGIESIHEELDTDFLSFLDEMALPTDLYVMTVGYWTEFDWRLKAVVLQHLYDLFNKDVSLVSPLEGLLRFFGIEIASHLAHPFALETVFPIGENFTDLSYGKFRQVLELLGIQHNDGQKQMPIDAWLNLSAAIDDYRQANNLSHWQMWALVYDFGPRILPTHGPYPTIPQPRIWIVSTNDSFGEFEKIDQHGEEDVGTWAINPKAKRGDLALMYCVSPRSALVGVYRCSEDAHEDPFGGWNGYRGRITDRIAIPWITFSEMKSDPIIGEWGLVKSQFQGLLKHEVPQEVWQRLIDIVSSKDQETGERLQQFMQAGEGTRIIKVSGEKWSEADVEEQLVIPVLNKLGWTMGETIVRQVPMHVKVGSGKPQCVKADFVGYADRLTSEPLLVIETKRKIGSTKDLDFAKDQAESYAFKLRCTRFGVASPEGFWIYQLNYPDQSQLLASVQLDKEISQVEMGKLHKFIGFDVLKVPA